jgi:hypothetical protein
MWWVSVNVMVGGTTTAVLVRLVETSSPLAAVHVLVPEPNDGPSVQSAVTVNRPRWVALPVASRWWLDAVTSRPLTIEMIRKLHTGLGISAEVLIRPYAVRGSAA